MRAAIKPLGRNKRLLRLGERSISSSILPHFIRFHEGTRNGIMIKALAPILLALALASCATVMTGKTDILSVDSSPSGARFVTNTGVSATTPAEIEVPDDVDVRFTFSLDGYADASATSKARMSSWVWANIVIGGVIGLIVDFASGGIYTHDKSVFVTLAPLTPSP
jgi:hypothetical protein